MMQKEEKKTCPITLEHWKNKFSKSICILKDSGIRAEDLIEEIRKVYEDKNEKN